MFEVPEIDESEVRESRKNLEGIESPLTAAERKQQIRSEIDQKARDMLTNKLSARPYFRRCSLADLEKIQECLTEVLEEKRIEEQERLERQADKQETLQKIAELMNSEEIDLDDISSFRNPSRKRNVRKRIAADGSSELVTTSRPNIIKYHCHIFDRDYWWNGQGHMPKPFKCHLAKGHTVESIQLDASEFFVLAGRSYNVIPAEYKQQAQNLLANFIKLKISATVKHPQHVSSAEGLPVKDLD